MNMKKRNKDGLLALGACEISSSRKSLKPIRAKKRKPAKIRKHSDAYYDFFYAFWITVVIDGAAILFVLSGMK